MANRLTLVPENAPEFHAYYWEPLVDGLPLRCLILLDPDERALDTAGLGPARHKIPIFAHSWPVGMLDEVLVLLGRRPAPLPGDRVPLFICPVCGDLGCGAVSAVLERTPTVVTWRDFGWDVDYETGDEHPVRYEGGPFVFDRAQYDAEIQRFIDTFDVVRSSVPPPPPKPSGDRPRHRRPWARFRDRR